MAAIAASVQGKTITIASVAAMAAPTPAKKNSPPWRRSSKDPVGAAMAAIAASVQGATITIASVAAMAAPTPAKKIAAMAAIEETPCGSRHGGD